MPQDRAWLRATHFNLGTDSSASTFVTSQRLAYQGASGEVQRQIVSTAELQRTHITLGDESTLGISCRLDCVLTVIRSLS